MDGIWIMKKLNVYDIEIQNQGVNQPVIHYRVAARNLIESMDLALEAHKDGKPLTTGEVIKVENLNFTVFVGSKK